MGAPEFEETFIFADLAGFTALTEAHGDLEATEIATRFADQVRALLPAHEAKEIKTIGDEVMIRTPTAAQGVRLGLETVGALAAPGSPPVRVGMHTGPAIERDGDWFGGTVNLASRIAGAAHAGEVLVTEGTRRACSLPDLEFETRGQRQFKNIPRPVAVFRVLGPEGAGQHLEIDPVCRMAVAADAPRTRTRHGVTYHFCSDECEGAFVGHARDYVATSPAARAAREGLWINLAAFLVVATVHLGYWLAAAPHGTPMFVYVGAVWALLLGVHYRRIRRAF